MDEPSAEVLSRRLARERAARKQAEQLLEAKSAELYQRGEQLAQETSERLKAEQHAREAELLASHSATLEKLNASLEQQIAETRQANAELQQANAQLTDAHFQLVQADKLASLGEMVAGFSHEVNTPIGIGVTAASHLQEACADFSALLAAGGLKKSALQAYVADCQQTGDIILANLERAAELVRSFKQVAVDQASSGRREFDLQSSLLEIVLSLQPKFDKSGIQLSVLCPEDILVDSYPGALSQVIANLVTNSLLHGFDGRDSGQIDIVAEADDTHACIDYRDDGLGMPADVISRLYDPFFTTKRGKGGSGLGMNIVYELVTDTLGGQIELRSEPGQGAHFNIRFPLQPNT